MQDLIIDNRVLITNNSIRKELLKNNKKLSNCIIMELNELIKKLTFDYDNEAIYYLMKKYNYKYDVAKVYLRNIYYINDKIYENESLNKLLEIKKELEEKNLLKHNKLFIDSIKNKEIVLYECNIGKYEKQILDKYNVKYIEENNKIYDDQKLYKFNTKENEVEFIATKIIELLNNGISINNIKIVSTDEEYKKEVKKIFSLYNINIENKIRLYDADISKKIINKIKNNIEIDTIKDEINLENEFNLKIYNKIIKLLNSYSFTSNYKDITEIIIHDLKNTYISRYEYKNKVEFINLEEYKNNESDYIFLPGFNVGTFPVTVKDEDYLSDDIKEKIGIDTSTDINKSIINRLIKKIKETNNLFITYRVNDSKEYYISPLNEELKLNIIDNYKIPYYNDLLNKIKLCKKIDLLSKYNELEEDIDLLYSNYSDIKYNKYDNKFTGINKELFKKYTNDKLLLSYSSMDNYFKCGFKYYIDNVLKLSPYEEKFATIIGSLFHHVLEKAFKDEFNLEKEYEEYLNSIEFEFSKKEKIFLKKLKKELEFIIETIKKQYNYISLNETLYEEKIYVTKDTNITFMGIIDKLMYKKEDDKTLIAIIDYKTGDPILNINNMKYGFDMQLPIYLYLSKRTNKLKNVEVLGFYLQKILNNEITINNKDTYEKQKENNLKLQGYSIDNEELLEKFDSTYRDSEMIRSMKIGKTGFNHYAKILNKETIDLIDSYVDKKINEAINGIKNADFKITQKKIDGKNISCKFCKYKDICYTKEDDSIYLEEQKDLDFLKE